VERIGVLSNVEVFLILNDPSRVREKRPVCANAGAVFLRSGEFVGGDRDQPSITNLHFTMQFNPLFRLAPVLWTVAPAAENEN